ncbi:MAG: O-antigen ligase family protein [Pseudomonadota bacterium]
MIKMTSPRQVVAAALVFLLPFLCLTTLRGVSISSFAFLIASLFLLKDGRAALVRHWSAVRWVVLAFLANFLFAFLCFQLRDHAPLGVLEKPSRMLFSIAALVVVLVARPSRKALWWGVTCGAIGAVVFVGYQRVELDLDRPGGLINAITFGDLSLCLGLIALAAAIDFRRARDAIWPCIGALAGLLGSIFTGTRGGWVALLFAAVLFIRYSRVMRSKVMAALVAASLALLTATYFIPATGMAERVAQGRADIDAYFHGGSVNTNVGIRLELWKGASMLIRQHPWFGIGSNEYKRELDQYVTQGKLDPVVRESLHLHNDAMQILVTGGVAGFAIWAATLIAPFAFFRRFLKGHAQASRQQIALSLAGLLLVTCYFSFGLTEVIFWSVKGSLFYALMIFMLMGFCLNAKDSDGK